MTKTAAPQLDDLYLPLRFHEDFDIKETEQGKLLDISTLLRMLTTKPAAGRGRKPTVPQAITTNALIRKRALTVTGTAGAGKTTWMRYTFRRMLRDKRTFPFMVELRALAKYWSEREQAREQWSIEAYLECWLTENAPEFRDAGVKLRDLLEAPASWLPVLLVDGWDELGEMGIQFREKLLGMMKHYPGLLVITTSRPYGSGRPSHSDGFVQRQVQPLNAKEINRFALNFYRKCYQEEEILTKRQVTAFGKALMRSADARVLAKTPLLLTMMLFINRSKQLPDKRHELYYECLMSLLSERPGMQMEEGAQLLAGQWCPPETGRARMQIVAKMAHDLQSQHSNTESSSNTGTMSAIVVPKETLKRFLPGTWSAHEKDGFLLWLCGRSGVMIDDPQDNISFAHLSFQEFLTAWHLNNNHVGTDAVMRFHELAASPVWWETLLLWAALLNEDSRKRAEEMLESLLTQNLFTPLIGMMLSDGVGTEAQVGIWATDFASLLCHEWPEQNERCLRAWQTSRQEKRKNELVTILRHTAGEAHWLAWLRINHVLNEIGIADAPILKYPKSVRQIPAVVLNRHLDSGPLIRSAEEFAGGRVLSGINAIWPGYPEGLLHIWPSERLQLALNLQRLASLGADRGELVNYLSHIDPGELASSVDIDLARDLNHLLNIDRILDRESEGDGTEYHLLRNIVRVFDIDFARDLARNLLLDSRLGCEFDRDLTRDFSLAITLARDLARFRSLEFTRDRAAVNLTTYLISHPSLDQITDRIQTLVRHRTFAHEINYFRELSTTVRTASRH